MRDIRVGFMLDKITLTDQRIQDYFPNRLLEAGFDHHLTKPVQAASLEKLLALIKPA
jgi:hypothetical protein